MWWRTELRVLAEREEAGGDPDMLHEELVQPQLYGYVLHDGSLQNWCELGAELGNWDLVKQVKCRDKPVQNFLLNCRFILLN